MLDLKVFFDVRNTFTSLKSRNGAMKFPIGVLKTLNENKVSSRNANFATNIIVYILSPKKN